jgi:CheY-like chemotaxis protein
MRQLNNFAISRRSQNRAVEMDIQEVRRWTSELAVLVAEDDQILRESFQQMLSYLFAEVDAAVDGQDAFDQWVKKQHDIVVTDLNMPRLSGFRLIEKIRQQSPQQPIVVISAHEDEIFQQELAVEEVNYLIKPVSLEELLNVLIPVCQSLPLEHQGY